MCFRSGAFKAGYPEYFASSDFETNFVQFPADRDFVGTEGGGSRGGGQWRAWRVGTLQHIASDHQTVNFVRLDISHTGGSDELPVLEDRQIVGRGQDLAEMMGDEADRDALGLQLMHDLEYRVHFSVVEISRRLIEKQSLWIRRDRARNLDTFQLAEV